MKFSGRSFPKEVILQCVRWYAAYCLSYRDLEEIMQERGVEVDHSTIQRWVEYYSPKLASLFNQSKKRTPGSSWRMDETYIKVKGQWKYLYRAVDSEGHTIDVLLTRKRDKKAALRFFKKAIKINGQPRAVNIDKSGSNTAALNALNEDDQMNIEIRREKYLNNIIEHDHRKVKRKMRHAKGFKSFHAAHKTIQGLELWSMLKKGQHIEGDVKSPIEQFYALTA